MQHGLYYQTQVPVFKRTVLDEDWELCAPVEIVARVEQGLGGDCTSEFDMATLAREIFQCAELYLLSFFMYQQYK